MNNIFLSITKVKDKHNANRYVKFIQTIIELNKTRNIDNECEVHHIIPKSLGGSNDKSNLIKLTYREHFIAHLILFKVYRNRGMAMAVMMMSNHGNKSSRLYEKSKTDIQGFISEKTSGDKNPMFGKLIVLDCNDKKIIIEKSEYNQNIHKHITIGENNPMFGKKHSEESKKKMSENHAKAFLGKKHSEESKKIIAEKLKGHKHSDESKKKMSESRQGSKNHASQPVSIDGVRYETIKEAMDKLNIGRKMIVHRCIISKNPKFKDWFYL